MKISSSFRKSCFMSLAFLFLAANASWSADSRGPRVSAGSAHCQPVRPDGSIWGWGMVLNGNLAEGSSAGHKGYKNLPVQAKGPGGQGHHLHA